MGWLPLPGARASRAQRLAAAVLLLAALSGAAVTWAAWRGDAADHRGEYARAVWWRPGVAIYHRHLGESLLVTDTPEAERQLLTALRLDPYSAETRSDLITVELALGHWPRALAATERQRNRRSGFQVYWRLANLYLSHADLAGYWQELALAAPHATPGDFPAIVSRSLTASGGDLVRLRAALPTDSIAAASAYLAAAVARGDLAAARAGERWLLSLPAGDPGKPEARLRRQAVIALLETAFARWPGEASAIWERAISAGILAGPAKQAAPPYLRDGDFSPAFEIALGRTAANPADPLRALLGWQVPPMAGVRFHPVYTGDAAHPTAAELEFDGDEADRVQLPGQWILAAGGEPLTLSALSRGLDADGARAPEAGLTLQLATRRGQRIAAVTLPVGMRWGRAAIRVVPPGSGIGTYRLSLDYERPNGEMPLAGRVLVTGIRVKAARP